MKRNIFQSDIILAPPSAESSPWINRFRPFSTGNLQGWMQVRGNIRRRNVEAGFALSDHADWDGLLSVDTCLWCKKVFVTHGFQSAFSRYPE